MPSYANKLESPQVRLAYASLFIKCIGTKEEHFPLNLSRSRNMLVILEDRSGVSEFRHVAELLVERHD